MCVCEHYINGQLVTEFSDNNSITRLMHEFCFSGAIFNIYMHAQSIHSPHGVNRNILTLKICLVREEKGENGRKENLYDINLEEFKRWG